MDTNSAMSIFELATAASSMAAMAKQQPQDNDTQHNQTVFARLLLGTREENITETRSGISSELQGTMTVSSRVQALSFAERLWHTGSLSRTYSLDTSTEQTIDASTPTTFVRSIAEPARLAAQQLGTTAVAVIAIAAHETGWGKHVIHPDGADSSHNLFGIKAIGTSTANAVLAKTSEYVNGDTRTLIEPFRTYNSASESVADFAEFIRSNPRYATALSQAQDGQTFIEQIHLAGYATDPAYATKVKSVMTQVERIMQSPHYQ